MVKFERPTEEHIRYLGVHMREADKHEIMLAHGHLPEEALRMSVNNSDYTCVGSYGDDICGIFGVKVHDILTGRGSPWLLGTDNIVKHRREFIPWSRKVVDQMLQVCPYLFNYVHVDNRVSIKWLEGLGFDFDEPAPFGFAGEDFMRFHRGI